MTDIVTRGGIVPATSDEHIAKLIEVEGKLSQLPQVFIDTHHVIHAGVYSRTIMIPAGVAIVGAVIKIPTTLIVSGECLVTIGDESVSLSGYQVFAAAAGRKQAFLATSDTWLTMMFRTDATSVEEAEEQFTDEAARLGSRHTGSRNIVVITGG